MKRAIPVFTIIISISITFLFLAAFYSADQIHAYYSNSTNYQLDAEFGEFGGSKSSASYNLTDTGGGFAVGFGSSANYGTGSGFQYVIAEVREITVVLSTNTVNMGSLTTTPKGVSQTVTVSTNGAGGYKVTILEDGNLCRITLPCDSANDIDDVSGGTVDASTEEYGLGTSKAGQYFAQDTDCSNTPFYATAIDGTARQAASATSPATNDVTTLCFSGAVTGTTAAGSYSQILTYITTGTF